MKVIKQYPITIISPMEVLFDDNDLKEAILWYTKKPVTRIKNVYKHGKYWGLSIYGEKIHIHRLLKMWELKQKIKTSIHVHHIDGDINNNKLNNLDAIDGKLHISAHLKGKKQDKSFALRRTNLSSIAKYGHPTKQYLQTIHDKDEHIKQLKGKHKGICSTVDEFIEDKEKES